MSPRVTHAAFNWLLALLIVAIFAGIQQLDHPSDHAAQTDQSDDAQDAIKTAAAEERFTRAAAIVCGNAGWAVQPDGAVRCIPRKGTNKVGAVVALAQVQP